MRRHSATMLWVRSIPITVLLALVAACSTPKPDAAKVAPAEQAPAAAATPGPAKPAPPVVASSAPVTNDAPTPAETPLPPPAPEVTPVDPKANPPEPAPDPVKWMQEQEAKRVEYQQSLDKLRADRDAAQDLVARTERDLLAYRNPYLARPNLTPGEAAEVQGLNGVERVKWAEARVANAIASLESAKKAYEDAKANPPAN